MLEFGIGGEGIRAYAVAASATGGGGSISGPGVAWELPGERLRGAADDLGGDRQGRPDAPDRGSARGRRVPRGGDDRRRAPDPRRRALRLRRAAALDRVRRARAHTSARRSSSGPAPRSTCPSAAAACGSAAASIDGPDGRLEAARFAWKLDGSPGGRRLRDPHPWRAPPRAAAFGQNAAAVPIRAVICDFGGVLTLPLIRGVRRLPGRLRRRHGAARAGDGRRRRASSTASTRCSSSSAGGSPRTASSTCSATASRPSSATGRSCTASRRSSSRRCSRTRR